MMEVILYLYNKAKAVVLKGIPISEIVELGLFERVTKMKYDVGNDNLDMLDEYYSEIDKAFEKIN